MKEHTTNGYQIQGEMKGGDHEGFKHGGFQGGPRRGYIRGRGRGYGGGRPLSILIVVRYSTC
jgi:hypothetical protein